MGNMQGANQEERQLPIITNEERSDKLYKVYKWYPLAWEPDLSRSDSGCSVVAQVCFRVGAEESEGEQMGSDGVRDRKGKKRGHTMTSPPLLCCYVLEWHSFSSMM